MDIQYRFATFDQSSINVEARTVHLAFSSERAVQRKFGLELLSHDPNDVDMSFLASGSAPVLFEHDTERQIGVVISASIDADRKGRAVVRFSKNDLADQIFNDIVDGIRKNISVGYLVHDQRVERRNGKDLVVAKWTPKEISVVSIPADDSVGIGRSAEELATQTLADFVDVSNIDTKTLADYVDNLDTKTLADYVDTDINPKTLADYVDNPKDTATLNSHNEIVSDATVIASEQTESRKDSTAVKEAKEVEIQTQTKNQKEVKMSDNVETIRAEVRKNELERINAIQTLTKRHGLESMTDDLIRSENGMDQIRGIVLDAIANKPVVNANSQTLGMSANEVRQYSMARGINAIISGDYSNAGLEIEASRAAAKAMGRPVSTRSLIVPVDYLVTRDAGGSALKASAATGFVATEHRPGSFIDAIFAATIGSKLGVQFLPGLVGDLEIPKLTSQGTAYWVGEGVDVTKSAPGTGAVTLSPKTVGSIYEYTRRMQLQSEPLIEGILRAHLEKVIAGAIDAAIFAAGGSGAPIGLTGATSGVTFLTNPTSVPPAATPWSYTALRALVKALELKDALNDNCRFAFSPSVAANLDTTNKDSNTAGIYLRNDDGVVAGYQSVSSTQVGNHLLFGDFSNVAIGQWGGIELAVDTSQLFASGGALIRALADVDVGILRADAITGYKSVAV